MITEKIARLQLKPSTMQGGTSLDETQHARAEHHERYSLESGARVGGICSGSYMQVLRFRDRARCDSSNELGRFCSQAQVERVKDWSAAALSASLYSRTSSNFWVCRLEVN